MVVDGVAVKYSRYNAEASFFLPFSGLDHAMTHPRFAFSRYSILLRSFFRYPPLVIFFFIIRLYGSIVTFHVYIYIYIFCSTTLKTPYTSVYSIVRIIITTLFHLSVKWIEGTINDKVQSVYWIFNAITTRMMKYDIISSILFFIYDQWHRIFIFFSNFRSYVKCILDSEGNKFGVNSQYVR